MKIAVTGVAGSGKSTFLKLLEDADVNKRFKYFSYDEILREQYREKSFKEMLLETLAIFKHNQPSQEVLDDPKALRWFMAQIIFTDPMVYEKIIPMLHEKVMLKLRKLTSAAEHWMAEPDCIVEFPMLFESHAEDMFDYVISVSVTQEDQYGRLKERGWTDDRIEASRQRQLCQGIRDRRSNLVVHETSIIDLTKRAYGEMTILSDMSRLKCSCKDSCDIAIVSGSFDPITNGHVWLIKEAMAIADYVVVVIATSSDKKLFCTEDNGDIRAKLVQEAINDEFGRNGYKIIVTMLPEGELLATYAQRIKGNMVIRGLRNTTDFEYERQLDLIQTKLNPELRTLFLMTPRELVEVSSTMIRSALKLREWKLIVAQYLPSAVFKWLESKS